MVNINVESTQPLTLLSAFYYSYINFNKHYQMNNYYIVIIIILQNTGIFFVIIQKFKYRLVATVLYEANIFA